MNIEWIGCARRNYETGRRGRKITSIVLHWIVGSIESCDATFKNPDRMASSHYAIGGDRIHQYVKEEDTAYANTNLISNLSSISVEHEGGWMLDTGERFKPTELTHETSAHLIAEICKRHNIKVDREHILKHSEVSDTPTSCPGMLDVERLVKRVKEIIKEGGEIMDELAKAKENIADFIRSKGYNNEELEGTVRAWWESDRVLKEQAEPKLVKQSEEITKLQKQVTLLDEKLKVLNRLEKNGEIAEKIEPKTSPDPFSTVKDIANKVYGVISKPQDLYKGIRRIRNAIVSYLAVSISYFLYQGNNIGSFDFNDLKGDSAEEAVAKFLIAIFINGVSKYVRVKELPKKFEKVKQWLFKWV